VARFAVSFPQTQSTAAVVQDPNVPATNVTPIIVGGGSNGTVRAYTKKGKQYWSFFATNDVVAAIMIDELQDPEVFYAADTNGRVFAVNVGNGRPLTQFSFATDGGAAITASPALGRDASTTMAGTTMYVGDQGGILYALNRFTGDELWRFQADGPINSSPAVAIGGSQDVIVFAADGPTASRMYAIRDDGTEGTSLWTGQDGEPGVTACGVVGASSPAIAADGTVYVGLQTIATNSTECEAVVQTNGGALVAFAP
jgi:outer membrane protein assembly factor BamB